MKKTTTLLVVLVGLFFATPAFAKDSREEIYAKITGNDPETMPKEYEKMSKREVYSALTKQPKELAPDWIYEYEEVPQEVKDDPDGLGAEYELKYQEKLQIWRAENPEFENPYQEAIDMDNSL